MCRICDAGTVSGPLVRSRIVSRSPTKSSISPTRITSPAFSGYARGPGRSRLSAGPPAPRQRGRLRWRRRFARDLGREEKPGESFIGWTRKDRISGGDRRGRGSRGDGISRLVFAGFRLAADHERDQHQEPGRDGDVGHVEDPRLERKLLAEDQEVDDPPAEADPVDQVADAADDHQGQPGEEPLVRMLPRDQVDPEPQQDRPVPDGQDPEPDLGRKPGEEAQERPRIFGIVDPEVAVEIAPLRLAAPSCRRRTSWSPDRIRRALPAVRTGPGGGTGGTGTPLSTWCLRRKTGTARPGAGQIPDGRGSVLSPLPPELGDVAVDVLAVMLFGELHQEVARPVDLGDLSFAEFDAVDVSPLLVADPEFLRFARLIAGSGAVGEEEDHVRMELQGLGDAGKCSVRPSARWTGAVPRPADAEHRSRRTSETAGRASRTRSRVL